VSLILRLRSITQGSLWLCDIGQRGRLSDLGVLAKGILGMVRNKLKRVDDGTMRSRVYEFLDQAEKEIRKGYLERFVPDSTAVNKVEDCVEGSGQP